MDSKRKISWFGDPRRWFRALLMLDDSSHRIALGAAIGIFVALTPTVGIQMVIVLTLAVLTRRLFVFNKVAALLMVYVSNPLTVVPLYWFNYKLGTIYFPGTTTRREFERLFQYEGLTEWWASFTRLFVDVGVPLVVGSLVVATCCGLATYPIVLRVIRNLRRAERQALRELRRAKRIEKQARKAAAESDAALANAGAQPLPEAGEQQAPADAPSGQPGRPNIGAELRSRVS